LVVIVTPRIIDTLHMAEAPPATAPAMAVPFLEKQKLDLNLPKN
jgi:hypothetical protein